MRRRDAHDIGAVGRERAAADRAGNDAGKIEHAQARERAILRWARQRTRGGLADPLDFEQGQPRHRDPLRVRLPFRRRAVERGDEAGFRHRGLELCALPLQEGCLHGFAVVGAVEQREDAVAVMRKIGVQAHVAAIAGAIDAGNLVPGRARRLAGEAYVTLAAEFHRGMAHVDGDRLRAAGASPPKLRRGQPGRRDRRLGNGTDAERGRQHRLGAGERHARQRLGLTPGGRPERCEDVGGREILSG